MERKINLAKIGKSAKIAKAVATPVIVGPTATESPYFSPVASRTRNNRNDTDAKATSTGVKSLSGETKPFAVSESVKNLEKKLATAPKKSTSRKHIKVEYDENKEPVDAAITPIEVKKEIKEEPNEDAKPVKQSKKRKSNDKKSEVKTEDIKTEEGTSSSGSATGEKQSKWEPDNWRQLLANIREMRKGKLNHSYLCIAFY